MAVGALLLPPVAMAQEAKRITKQRMQAVIDQLGLSKQMTVGEFYTKNKHLFPPQIQKKIQPLLMANKNQIMPSFTVSSSKTTLGEEIATLLVTQNTEKGSELINIQWFGEPNRMFRFQNTNISEKDIINFDDMFERIVAGDEKYKKQIQQQTVAKTSTRYPNITKAEWKSMSPYDRANYIVNLRLLWQDAKQVLRAKNTQKGPIKKTPKTSQNFFEKNKFFFSLFIGAEAEAIAKPVVGTSKTVATGKTPGNYFSGESCIVAGYVVKYQKKDGREVCDYEQVDKVYANRDNSLYLKAKEYCNSSTQIACNPYVFGAPNGRPLCVTPSVSDPVFQRATHWDGPCDSGSRLSTTKFEILNPPTKTAELIKTEQGQENYKLTEEYLLGILKFRGVVKTDAKSIFESGVLSEEVFKQITLDKNAFDREIAEANQSCDKELSASETRVHEKNYQPACDQLRRRFLFVNELFTAKCGAKALNPSTLKCSCSPAVNEVIPGGECGSVNQNLGAVANQSADQLAKNDSGQNASAQTPSDITTAKPWVDPDKNPNANNSTVTSNEECEAKYPGALGFSHNCMCTNGKPPKYEGEDEATGQKSYSCGDTDDGNIDKDKSKCGFICKMWKGTKKIGSGAKKNAGTIGLFALGGIGAYAAYKYLAPEKPKLNPPLDACPNGAASCTPSSVKVESPPVAPTTSPQIADPTTPTLHKCWNGSEVENLMNCPLEPPTITNPIDTNQ